MLICLTMFVLVSFSCVVRICLRRGVRAGYRSADEPTAAQLVENSDHQLFRHVQYDNCHVLH